MKRLLVLLCALALAGCVTTNANGEKEIDDGKTALLVGAAALAVALAADNAGSDDENCYWVIRPGGDTYVCR